MDRKELSERYGKTLRLTALVVLVLLLVGSIPAAGANDTEQCYYGPPAPNQTVENQTAPNTPYLIVETRHLYQPNSTHDYLVYRVEAEPDGDLTQYNVTGNATVVSSDPSNLSVDQSAYTLSSTQDENTSTWVRLDANTSVNEGCANVMVSNTELSSLETLPGIWRWIAAIQDPGLFALLIAVFLAVPTTRFTTAFGGLAIGQMVLVVGWFAGYIQWQIAVASLFVVLFIGFNLSQNVEIRAGGKGR